MEQVEANRSNGEDSDCSSEQFPENQFLDINRQLRSNKHTRGTKGNSETDAMYNDALIDEVFGRFEEAARKLKQIITLAPDNPQPYHLLSNIHEETGQHDKAVEYFYMYACLSPPSLEKWRKAADRSFGCKMYQQAAYCYGRALKIENYNIELMERRAEAFELSGQSKKAIITYKKMLKIIKSEKVIKKFARLRFRRGEYAESRAVLQTFQGHENNEHMVNMICETYLKEKNYAQAAEALMSFLETAKSCQQSMPFEFLKIIFICSVALGQTDQTHQHLKLLLEEYYQAEEEAYEEIVKHIRNFNEDITFKVLQFLINYPRHRSVQNFLFLTQYLKNAGRTTECLKCIEEAAKEHPKSIEINAEKTYLRKLLNVKERKVQNSRIETVKKALPNENIENMKHNQDQIYYSDEEKDDFVDNTPNISQLNRIKTKATKSQVGDPQLASRLLRNNKESMHIILRSISQGQVRLQSYCEQVMNVLDFVIKMSQQTKNHLLATEIGKQGLYLREIPIIRASEQASSCSFIEDNIQDLRELVAMVIDFMLCLLKQKQYRKIIQVGERVSKIYFLKWQYRCQKFRQSKTKIFEICLFACLSSRKFASAIYFVRFLVSKYPENQLYLLVANFLLRRCPGKVRLSPLLNKTIDSHKHLRLQSMTRLLAIEYMQSKCFDMALASFLKVVHSAKLSQRKQIYLCMSSCLLQLASSRNTFNKIQFTNRSAYLLAKYAEQNETEAEVIFNKGRWFAQVRLQRQAIDKFTDVLKMDCAQQLKKRAAYCLITIYQEIEQFDKCNQISSVYFPIE